MWSDQFRLTVTLNLIGPALFSIGMFTTTATDLQGLNLNEKVGGFFPLVNGNVKIPRANFYLWSSNL